MAQFRGKDRVLLHAKGGHLEKLPHCYADPATVVEELQQQKGGDIIVLASGSVIKSLLSADALDRLSITLCPEVAGGGARLFEDGLPRSSWSLRQCAVTESGAVCLLYDRVLEGK